ncbi:MAG TPA: hypothetical protein VMZ91_11015 [Candidatus Paceibacterota bacterium]|nr:hypothetical protein [Candidatus Paceibacterota bacterium]
MKTKNIINKKAQIGATLTWIVAFLIIFFIMILFISTTIIISAKKTSILSLSFSQKETTITSHITGDFAVQRNLISFLNKPIKFEGKDIFIKDLIADKELNDENKARFEKFVEEASKFIDENFPLDKETPYRKTWLRVYRSEEEISQYTYTLKRDNLDYDDYEVYKGSSSRSDNPCNPTGIKKSVISDVNSMSSYVFIDNNKKIAICVEYK